MGKRARRSRRSAGQVLSEYVIVLVVFSLVAIALVTLTHYFSWYGGRLVNAVGMEYP